MKKYILIVIGILSISFNSISQNTKIEDQKAQAILDSTQKNYNFFKNMSADFTLTAESGDEYLQKVKGRIYTKGDKMYSYDIPDYLYNSDGKSTWVVLKKQKGNTYFKLRPRKQSIQS